MADRNTTPTTREEREVIRGVKDYFGQRDPDFITRLLDDAADRDDAIAARERAEAEVASLRADLDSANRSIRRNRAAIHDANDDPGLSQKTRDQMASCLTGERDPLAEEIDRLRAEVARLTHSESVEMGLRDAAEQRAREAEARLAEEVRFRERAERMEDDLRKCLSDARAKLADIQENLAEVTRERDELASFHSAVEKDARRLECTRAELSVALSQANDRVSRAEAEVARLAAALREIAKRTHCDRCEDKGRLVDATGAPLADDAPNDIEYEHCPACLYNIDVAPEMLDDARTTALAALAGSTAALDARDARMREEGRQEAEKLARSILPIYSAESKGHHKPLPFEDLLKAFRHDLDRSVDVCEEAREEGRAPLVALLREAMNRRRHADDCTDLDVCSCGLERWADDVVRALAAANQGSPSAGEGAEDAD